MPRATAEPPIVYSKIKAQPTNQATLQTMIVLISLTDANEKSQCK